MLSYGKRRIQNEHIKGNGSFCKNWLSSLVPLKDTSVYV